MSWHYHEREAHFFSHLPPYEKEWDGHSSEEKYDRLFRAALPDMSVKSLYRRCQRANGRIEELEAALRRISHAPYGKVFNAHGHEEAYLIALNALGEKKDD